MKEQKSLIPIEIYTDGSAKGVDPAHKAGGWAYCILKEGKILRQDSGSAIDTTNQRMELQAIVEGLKGCEELKNENSAIYEFYSDSAYAINCYLQEWYVRWEKNGWFNAKRQPVANVDLWEKIIPFFKNKNFNFNKVKGHADNYYNNLVDRLAQEEASKMVKRYSSD